MNSSVCRNIRFAFHLMNKILNFPMNKLNKIGSMISRCKFLFSKAFIKLPETLNHQCPNFSPATQIPCVSYNRSTNLKNQLKKKRKKDPEASSVINYPNGRAAHL